MPTVPEVTVTFLPERKKIRIAQEEIANFPLPERKMIPTAPAVTVNWDLFLLHDKETQIAQEVTANFPLAERKKIVPGATVSFLDSIKATNSP
jgi:hypothetical protein